MSELQKKEKQFKSKDLENGRLNARAELDSMLDEFLGRLFWIGLVLGGASTAASVLRVLQIGWKWSYAVQLFFIVVAPTLLGFRKHFKSKSVLLAVFLLVGLVAVANLWSFGLASMGVFLLAYCITVVSAFTNLKTGLIGMALAILVLAAIGTGICTGFIPQNFDANIYLKSWTTWVTQISLFVCLTVIILISIDRMQVKLIESVEALTKSEERLRLALDVVSDGVFDWDMQTDRGYFSANNFTMLGYTPDDLPFSSESWFSLIHPDDVEGAVRILDEYREADRQKHDVEYRIKTKDGTWKWILSRGAIVQRAADAKSSRLLGTNTDIDERKRIEQAHHQAEKMEAVGQLAGGIAHDFNNQLSGILAFAEMIERKAGKGSILAGHAGKIVTGVERASDLTAKLLAFASKGAYVRKPVDVHALILEVATVLERTKDRRIAINARLEAMPHFTLGDASQLQNALLNLGLNACDAMPEGGRLVFATQTKILDDSYCAASVFDVSPGPHISVSVTDTGPGIEDEDLPRIFEPFFTTKDPSKGTGLGLAAVHGNMQAHKGAVEVESRSGKGSTFTLYLPLEEGAAAEVPPSSEPADLPRGKARVLLVDDDELVSTAASMLLSHLGYSVDVCSEGQNAIERFRADWRNIDLVVLDLVMPGMSGRQIFDEMLAIDPEVKVVVSSGYSIDGDAESLLAKGAKGFMQKPFRLNELSEKLNEILSSV